MSSIGRCPLCASGDVFCGESVCVSGLSVRCNCCGCTGPSRASREMAIDAWNQRPELQALSEAHWRYERALQELDRR